MTANLANKLLQSHFVEGSMVPGKEVGLRIEQVLIEDALGTLVMLELEAMNAERVKTEIAVQYVDHNLLETNNLAAEEHAFLRSACQRYGLWYSRPGNGISHATHMQRFGKPGMSLAGSDSHTPAAGSLGMLAIGIGGVDVAMALLGEPLYVTMPETWGIRLEGELPDWVSAKDVILELLRRHSVCGGLGRIIEYYGPGLASLSAMDRHVIANQGAEMGATTSVFPSDERTRAFLKRMGREDDWYALAADDHADYDHHDEVDLAKVEPMLARPSSPDNVERVRDTPKADIYQSYIGSSANPGFRDFAVAARIVAGRKVHDRISFDINPSTRQVLRALVEEGHLGQLIEAGARIHQPGCNGCIGMGQAPAQGRNSLRTVPRNFPGRSGTQEDAVFLCSPETAAASALMGVITDPRDLDMPYPRVMDVDGPGIGLVEVEGPLEPREAATVKLAKTPNIVSLPEFKPPGKNLKVSVLLKAKDHISTDDITPADAQTVTYSSNIPKLADFAFHALDASYVERAKAIKDQDSFHAIVGGHNYGQGSSREHSAVIPAFLGLQLVVAKSFARIHWQNLINFGILPMIFANENDYEQISSGSMIEIDDYADKLFDGDTIEAKVDGKSMKLKHKLSNRQIDIIQKGSVINQYREANNIC